MMHLFNEGLANFWAPLLFIVLSVPLILEKIPPNHIYGFRTKKTLTNTTLWYKTNKYCGWGFLIAGIILFVYRLFESYFTVLQGTFNGAVIITVLIVSIALMIYTHKIHE